MSEVYASKRGRIDQLYTLSTSVNVGPEPEEGQEPDEDHILYVRKLTVPQERQASTESYKVRAKYEIIKRADKDDPERLAVRDAVLMIEDKEQLATLVLSEEYAKLQASTEARIAAEDYWAQNDYLETLQASWLDEMKERLDRNPEDEDAQRVFKELKKYTLEVDEAVQAEFDDMLHEKMQASDDMLIEEAVDKLLDTTAISAQVEEFNYWKVYFSTYEDKDFKHHFFRDVDDVRNSSPELIAKLLEAYDSISLGVLKGKD